jgi:hypothetical protein
MIIYNKNGFTKFECPSCLKRFKIPSHEYVNDFCSTCEPIKGTFPVIYQFAIPIIEIIIDSIPLEATPDEIQLDKRHIDTKKIIKKSKKER